MTASAAAAHKRPQQNTHTHEHESLHHTRSASARAYTSDAPALRVRRNTRDDMFAQSPLSHKQKQLRENRRHTDDDGRNCHCASHHRIAAALSGSNFANLPHPRTPSLQVSRASPQQNTTHTALRFSLLVPEATYDGDITWTDYVWPGAL